MLPLEGLMLNFSASNSLLLSWLPPVYYVPAGLPLTYQVHVTNVEGDEIHYTNETFIDIANVTECDVFNVNVTALFTQYISISSIRGNNGSM